MIFDYMSYVYYTREAFLFLQYIDVCHEGFFKKVQSCSDLLSLISLLRFKKKYKLIWHTCSKCYNYVVFKMFHFFLISRTSKVPFSQFLDSHSFLPLPLQWKWNTVGSTDKSGKMTAGPIKTLRFQQSSRIPQIFCQT